MEKYGQSGHGMDTERTPNMDTACGHSMGKTVAKTEMAVRRKFWLTREKACGILL